MLDKVTEFEEAEEFAELPPEAEAAAAEAEAEYERFVWKNLPRNFAAHFLHGMLGMTGMRIFNAPTFLPAYLHSLTGSDALVGLGQSLQQLGAVVSPVVGATHIEHRKRVLPVSMLMGTLMRLQILGVALAGWFLFGQAKIVAILLFLFLFGLFSGAQQVAFQMLLAKVIPISRRGSLQAVRNVTGGAIAAGLAYVAGRYLIQKNVFGNGYSTTFFLAFVLTSLGLTALSLLMKEPEPPTVRAKSRIWDRIKDFPELITSDRDYAWFMVAQTTAMAGRVAAPFYILYAGHVMHLTGGNLGLVSLVFLGSDVVTNMLWGLMGDRWGFRSTFVGSLSLWILATGLLIYAPSIPLILVSFFGLGSAQSGFQMSATTMVLEFGDRHDMAMRLALSSTTQGLMATLGPLCGGLVAASFGYKPVFMMSMLMLGVSLVVLVTMVKEPRLRRLPG
ncbi:MAG: MFS transporter [Caulobacterales bacterium]